MFFCHFIVSVYPNNLCGLSTLVILLVAEDPQGKRNNIVNFRKDIPPGPRLPTFGNPRKGGFHNSSPKTQASNLCTAFSATEDKGSPCRERWYAGGA